MEQASPPLEEYEQALRQAGQMVTVQRRAMLRYLLLNRTHPTAAEIAGAVAQEHSASLATVYNNLALFAQLGLVSSVRGPDGETRWDVRTDRHHHLLCIRCGRVDDIDAGLARVVVDDPALAARVDRSEVWFAGRCSCCI